MRVQGYKLFAVYFYYRVLCKVEPTYNTGIRVCTKTDRRFVCIHRPLEVYRIQAQLPHLKCQLGLLDIVLVK